MHLHLDLFTGIGGFLLAAKRAGFRSVQAVEIEPFCQAVLRKNFPGLPIHGDIRDYDATHLLGAIGLLTGGFPCQDISVAGKGKGIEGERSGLWAEMFRIIRECRPAFCLIENVPALRHRGADRVLSDLEAAGYTGEAFVVGADTLGATHRRKRVWIVAYSERWLEQKQGNPEHDSETPGQRETDKPRSADNRLLAHAAGRELEGHQSRVCGANSGREVGRHAEWDAGAEQSRSGYKTLAYPDELNGRWELPQSGMREQRTRVECEGDGRNLPAFPPARNDFRGWASVASVDASLMPCSEREVRPVANGLSSPLVRRRQRTRNARLKALGNAIVPQVAELFCRWIYRQLELER